MKSLIFIETADNEVKKGVFEIISAAKEMGDVTALVIGKSDVSDQLAQFGVTKILKLENEMPDDYAPMRYASAIADGISEESPDIIVFSATRIGMELAPLVAAKLDIPMASDCVGFSVENDSIRVKRPVYAGKSFISVTYEKLPVIVTVRPNSFDIKENPNSAETVSFSSNLGNGDVFATVKEVIQAASKRMDLTEADIIVSGGRGVGSEDGFAPLEVLADEVNAAVGASRAAVDAGWRDHSDQVGQTGKTVSPQLYIACGISGAIQHLAGMNASQVIVAVNKDPDAPIFKNADYGIVADLFEVLPILTEEIKKIRA